MKEPTLAAAIKHIHKLGWYTTFMYENRGLAEGAKDSTELLRLFLRHMLQEAVQSHVADQLRERCKPILEEARGRGCLFFKLNETRTSIILTFNNGVDMQYTRALGHVRLWKKYGVYPDRFHFEATVQSFFLNQDNILPMRHGIPRWLNKLAGTRRT